MFSHGVILIQLYSTLLVLQLHFSPSSKRCCDFIHTCWPWAYSSDTCSKTFCEDLNHGTFLVLRSPWWCLKSGISNATKGHRHLAAFFGSEVWKIPLSCLAPMFLPQTFTAARHGKLPDLEGDKQIQQKAWVLWWIELPCQMLRCSSQVQNVQSWVNYIPRNLEKWVWED